MRFADVYVLSSWMSLRTISLLITRADKSNAAHSLAIEILQPVTLIHHDELPLDARQEVPVLHTHLVGGNDNGERGSGVCSARSGRLATSLGGSYTGHGRGLKASRTELGAVVWVAVIHKSLGASGLRRRLGT